MAWQKIMAQPKCCKGTAKSKSKNKGMASVAAAKAGIFAILVNKISKII